MNYLFKNNIIITDKKELKIFLKTYFSIYGIYTISKDGIIDVDGDVTLQSHNFSRLNFTEFPIQFGHVTGSFYCENSNITSFKGFPHTVDGRCSINNSEYFTTLENSPKCGIFLCHKCIGLKSLDGLNCEKFVGDKLKLKKFGKIIHCRSFDFTKLPKPTAREMRHLIAFHPHILCLINDYNNTAWINLLATYELDNDILKAAARFLEIYKKPLFLKSPKIEIDHNMELSM